MRIFGLRSKAIRDLLARYITVFRFAWGNRATADGIPRLAHELSFLPAALELQETPVSPTPRVAMWTLICFAGLALVWAVFGRIDIVASAQGRIVAGDRTKTIQAFETATVRAIHVSDGQAVRAGDVLIDLDTTTTRADQGRVRSDLMSAQMQVVRAEALLRGMERREIPRVVRPDGVDESRFHEAERQVHSQYGEIVARVARIDADIARREAEFRSTQETVRKIERTLPIARQRAEDLKALAEDQYAPRHSYLEREQVRIELEADLATQRSRLKEIEASLHEARQQRVEVIEGSRRASLDSLSEGKQKVDALSQELIKADSRDKLMQLRAPVDGVVQQLAIHTVGGVVTPAQPLMVVVPSDDQIEVEAFVENKDIGFVQPGQDVEIKIETFLYTKYGTVHAQVASVSHDAINDEKRGLIYSARIRIARATMNVDGVNVRLSPGMAVTAEIKTGKRRVIEYFLSPLVQVTSESMRER